MDIQRDRCMGQGAGSCIQYCLCFPRRIRRLERHVPSKVVAENLGAEKARSHIIVNQQGGSGRGSRGAYLVHLEPFKETPHILFLYMASKLTTPGFFNHHVLITVTLEFSVHNLPLALPSEVPG